MKLDRRKKHNILASFYFFVFFLANWTAPLMGQVPAKRLLQLEEFGQWSELGETRISNDGKWACVYLWTENGPDTLKVLSTFGKEGHSFPNSRNGAFSDDSKWFAFASDLKGVGIIDINLGTVRYKPKGQSFKFSNDGKFMAIYIKPEKSDLKENLFIYDFEKKDSLILTDVSEYRFSPVSNEMLYVSNENTILSLTLLNLNNLKKTVISTAAKNYKYLMWNESENSFFFIQNHSLLCYVDNKKDLPIAVFHQSQTTNLFQKTKPGIFPPFFSKDGKRIFFYMHKDPKLKATTDTFPNVQLWRGTDKWIYPRTKQFGSPADWRMLYVWEPATGKLEQIASPDKPQVVITANSDYALRYNILDYEPEYLQFPRVDIYLKNLNTGEERLLIKKQQTGIGYVQLSPSGNQICFFNGQDWINYSLHSGVFTNLTSEINASFFNKDSDTPEPPAPHGMVGWTTEDGGVVVYDKFDLWYISIDGKKHKRLTKGRESKTVYRVYTNLTSAFPHSRFPQFNGNEINLAKDIMLFVKRKNKSAGYQILKANGEIEDFAISLSKTSELQKATDSETYIFIRETGETPKQVFVKNDSHKVEKVFYQNNPHYKNFKSGKRELISFSSGDWKNLNGILYYPDDYKPDIKYPMITKIYEIQSPKFYEYLIPTLYSRDGYNIRNLTASGYFVFEPDIRYRIGDPGLSALECVTSAVAKILERGEVDIDRIGLIGHSYGGFETAFIIGQTNIFKVAIAGAPVTNMLSYYLSINSDEEIPQIWRVENQQFRMGKSYFDDPAGYCRNSPIKYVKNINTPLMIWAGDQDRNINWLQSVEMYLALRRLKKNVTFYLYPGEAHDLNNPKNQKNLSQNILQWFNKYLKPEM